VAYALVLVPARKLDELPPVYGEPVDKANFVKLLEPFLDLPERSFVIRENPRLD
jgi:hypothetical protein